MANDAKNEKKQKIDKDFIEEENNGKFILVIILSILVVLALIIGSVYYFNKDTEEPEKENNKPVEVIDDQDLEEDENEEPEIEEKEESTSVFEEIIADNQTTEDTNEENPNEGGEVPVEITYTVKYLNASNEQIGEDQLVKDLSDAIEPAVPEKEGYKGTWTGMCDNETNVCTYTPKYEKIIVTMSEGSTYNINLNGNVIEATGLVIENGTRDENGNRSYIEIKFIAPDEITKEMVEEMKLTITTEGVDGGITENGITILDSTKEEIEEEIFYFNYTVAVDNTEDLVLPEIAIDWGNGVESKYTIDINGIEIQSYAEYIGITKPTVDDANKEGTLTGAGDVTYNINAELDSNEGNVTSIIVEGEVNNYENKTGIMEVVGLDEYNNILTIKFTAPENITDFTNLKVITEQNTYEGPGLLDGENYFFMYQAVDPGTTSNPRIIIDWDGDSGELKPETYVINTDTIKLTPTEELKNTVSSTEESTYNQNLIQNHEGENIIEVTGEIKYNEENKGYLIETTFKPVEGTFVDEDKITVTDKDGKNIYEKENLIIDSEGHFSYSHTEQVENTNSSPGITIDWNGGETQGGEITYNYDISNVELVPTT